MGILAWIVLGLIAGLIAKALHPGRDPGGVITTIVIGILGGLVGGFIGRAIFGSGVTGFNLWSLLLAIGGAFLLLVIWRLITRSRARPIGP